MNSEKLGYIEAIGLISIIIIHEIVLNIPKKIIDKTGSSSWLNIIFITIITIIYVLCGRDFPAFFTESSYIGILFGVVLVFVSLILRYGAELEKKEKNEEKEE